MLWSVVPLAVVGLLPPVEDITVFGPRAQQGLTAIPGCFSLGGAVTQHQDAGILGEEDHTYTFTATLREGVWSDVVVTSRFPESPRMNLVFQTDTVSLPFVPPLLGEVAGAREEGSLLTSLLTLFSTSVETEAVTTMADGAREVYRYERYMDSRRSLFKGARANHAEVLFDPATLGPYDWHLVTEIPERTGEGFRVHDVDARLRIDASGAPAEDVLDAQGIFGPFKLRVVRTIRYTNLGPCAG